MKAQAIEDNGGGLALYVFDSADNVIWSHSGYEYNRGQLTTDLKALLAGADPADWDGCDEDPQGNYDATTRGEYGWMVVAAIENGKLTTYPEVMGTAGNIEFTAPAIGEAGRPPLYDEPMRQTAVWLPQYMIDWLREQPGTMSQTIRALIQSAIDN